MPNELISVIVPVYNVEKYLKRCVESILRQTYKNFELILVDDGSTDSSGEICDRYMEIDNRIKVIHKYNGGLSSARNAGLDTMCGEFLTFVDSDDFVSERYLEVLYGIIKKYGVSISQVAFERGDKDLFSQKQSQRKIVKVCRNIGMYSNRDVKTTVWAKLYHRKIFETIRFPLDKIYEDEFVTYKAIAFANCIAVSSENLYYYFKNPGSIMNSIVNYISLDFQEAYYERIRFFEERGDQVAADYSRQEYALNIMLTYAKCIKSPTNINDKGKMLVDYERIYSSIQNKNQGCIKERIILYMFHKFPMRTAKMFNIIRK